MRDAWKRVLMGASVGLFFDRCDDNRQRMRAASPCDFMCKFEAFFAGVFSVAKGIWYDFVFLATTESIR